MSTTSPLLKLTLQVLDENPDTWGDIVNVSALQLLEDSIAGTSVISLTAATDYTLDDAAGGPTETDGARYMILAVSGTPGGATNIIVPTRSKIYVAANNTSDASDIVIKTVAGTGPTIPNGEAHWVYCDGTDVLAVSVLAASTATSATTATDSDALTGVAGADFAQKAVAQTFTAGQVTQRVVLTDAAGDITPDLSLSNSFFHEMLQGENLATPTNPTNGAQFSLVLEQGVGAPWALTFQASTFLWEGGVAPTLSLGVGDIDYLAFEYVTDAAVGNRWIGSILKDVS